MVVGEQYQEPPTIDIQFPLESDLVNYTRKGNLNFQSITIPSSLVQERLKEAGNDGRSPDKIIIESADSVSRDGTGISIYVKCQKTWTA